MRNTEWKQAIGKAGYDVAGPVYGAYCNGTALFVWQHGDYWTGVVCGHGSTSGKTREEAQENAKAWALKADRRDADRRVSVAQFQALMETA